MSQNCEEITSVKCHTFILTSLTSVHSTPSSANNLLIPQLKRKRKIRISKENIALSVHFARGLHIKSCLWTPSSKKLLFATNGDHTQTQSRKQPPCRTSPSGYTYTTALAFLLREHHKRGSKRIIQAQTPGSLMLKHSPRNSCINKTRTMANQ